MVARAFRPHRSPDLFRVPRSSKRSVLRSLAVPRHSGPSPRSQHARVSALCRRALTRLHGDLSTLRSAVVITTRAGDPARAALRIDTPLTLTYALVDLAPAVIEGACSVQARFPALTDAAIADAETSLDAARVAVSEARSRKIDDAVNRLDGLDERQLALDVLLDCIDHLRAAAKTTLGKTRPRVGEALSAPIEPQRARSVADTDDPPQPA